MKDERTISTVISATKGCRKNIWLRAMPFYKKIRRYANSLEEAQEALDIVRKKFNGKPKVETEVYGMIGATSIVDEKTPHSNSVIGTKIKKRMVTEWEEI